MLLIIMWIWAIVSTPPPHHHKPDFEAATKCIEYTHNCELCANNHGFYSYQDYKAELLDRRIIE